MNSLSLQLRYEFDMFFGMVGLVLIKLASVSLPVHGAMHRRVAYARVESSRSRTNQLSKTLKAPAGQNSNVVYWKKSSLTADEIDYLRSKRRSYSNPWHNVSETSGRKVWSKLSLVRLKALEASYKAPAAPERDFEYICR
ncbi:MAG: hypothetical protein IPK73_27655 [Candidatus Obscuribacter sp.]|nr:hypothetical protein [Candidatus Obscuribacter sp.]MBK9277902.1 hypothetical protein [Candidatus Obscuribacter sp.]MBL8082377.1 hypothetical protein [Candidatus Obscuribacter sp.]